MCVYKFLTWHFHWHYTDNTIQILLRFAGIRDTTLALGILNRSPYKIIQHNIYGNVYLIESIHYANLFIISKPCWMEFWWQEKTVGYVLVQWLHAMIILRHAETFLEKDNNVDLCIIGFWCVIINTFDEQIAYW